MIMQAYDTGVPSLALKTPTMTAPVAPPAYRNQETPNAVVTPSLATEESRPGSQFSASGMKDQISS